MDKNTKKQKAINAVINAKDLVIDNTKDAVDVAKDNIIKIIDKNGNGEIDIEDFIILALQTPGIRVNRANFLQKELFNKYPQETIDDAIAFNPIHAKIDRRVIDKIADEVIAYERFCVAGIAAALGVPGGFSIVPAAAADLIQYYGYLIRALQKLMYLYGFPEINTTEKNNHFDSEMMNTIIISLGVMFNVNKANVALKAIAGALGKGVEKKLLEKALTKGVVYPIVKNVAKWFGVRMTKQIYAGFFRKAIPAVGAVVSGGITYLSFKPCCDRLKNTLQDTMLSNPDYVPSYEETDIINTIITSSD